MLIVKTNHYKGLIILYGISAKSKNKFELMKICIMTSIIKSKIGLEPYRVQEENSFHFFPKVYVRVSISLDPVETPDGGGPWKARGKEEE